MNKLKHCPEVFTNILTTQEGWKDFIIPMLGSIAIPLLILFLTWFFGSVRANKIKQKKDDIEKLSYLRSLMYYIIPNLLKLHKLLSLNEDVFTVNDYTWPEFYKKNLFGISVKDTYSQFEPQQYVNFLEISPSLVTHLLDVKSSLIVMFSSIEIYNQNITKITIGNNEALLRSIHQNLLDAKYHAKQCISGIMEVLKDISIVEKKSKLKLVQILLSPKLLQKIKDLGIKNQNK